MYLPLLHPSQKRLSLLYIRKSHHLVPDKVRSYYHLHLPVQPCVHFFHVYEQVSLYALESISSRQVKAGTTDKKTKDKYGKNSQLLLKLALLKTLRYAKSQFLANTLQFVQDEQSDNAKSL